MNSQNVSVTGAVSSDEFRVNTTYDYTALVVSHEDQTFESSPTDVTLSVIDDTGNEDTVELSDVHLMTQQSGYWHFVNEYDSPIFIIQSDRVVSIKPNHQTQNQ